jgi:hypothetical protein
VHMLQPDLQRLLHGALLRQFLAGSAAISYPGKIAFPPRSYNGAEREERRRKNISTF